MTKYNEMWSLGVREITGFEEQSAASGEHLSVTSQTKLGLRTKYEIFINLCGLASHKQKDTTVSVYIRSNSYLNGVTLRMRLDFANLFKLTLGSSGRFKIRLFSSRYDNEIGYMLSSSGRCR